MKDMMKKAKRMLAYLIVLVMCVDMVSQSSFVSRAQEATEKTEETAAAEKPAADQQVASATESKASEPKEAGAGNGVVGTTTGTQSAETGVPKTENASEEQTVEKPDSESTGDQKAELTEEEKAAADLVSRIEQALAGIPDQGSLKGTEEEMEALNKQGQNLQDLYEECNEYKDIEEVAAAQESLAQAITRLQELMGLSAQVLAACGENCTHVAAIGNEHFDTPQAAISAVSGGGTVTLLKQWAKTGYIYIGKSINFDLNNLHIYSNNTTGTIIIGSNANVTIYNGKISSVGNRAKDQNNSVIVVQQGSLTLKNVKVDADPFKKVSAEKRFDGIMVGLGKTDYIGELTLDEGTVVSGGQSGVAVLGAGENNQITKGKHSTLIINKDAVVTGLTYGIAGNGLRDDTIITINGGTVTATGGRVGEAEYSTGIYHPQQGTLTINGGIIKGKVGVQMAAGIAEINGGTLESTDTETVEAPFKAASQGDGMVLDGAALSMVSRSAYGNISVTVQGGTFDAHSTNKPIQKYGMQKTTTAWEVIAEPTQSSLTISGGTFSNAFDTSYCAEGYYLKFLSNGCTVEESKGDGESQPAVGITVPSNNDSGTASMTLIGTTVTDLVGAEDATDVTGITLKTETISTEAIENASDKVKEDVKKIVETVSQTSNIQANIKAAVELDDNKQVSDVKIQSYLDINLFKVKETTGDSNNDDSNKISETKKALSFTVPIPKGAKEGEKFVVLRNHNGEVAVLLCEQDDQAGTLTFETDLFSVYAIASYKEVKAESTTGGGGNNGGGSGSSNDSSQPTQAAPIISVEPAIMEAAPAAAPKNAAAVPPQPVEEEKKTQEPALKEDKTAKRKETTFGDAAADDLVTIENDDTPLAIGKTESNWLIWILSGMSVLFAAAFVGFELLTKKRRDEE